jgi:hypothetical protein
MASVKGRVDRPGRGCAESCQLLLDVRMEAMGWRDLSRDLSVSCPSQCFLPKGASFSFFLSFFLFFFFCGTGV